MTKAIHALRNSANASKKMKFSLLNAMKAHGGEEVYIHSFLISALDWGEWSAHAPGLFTTVVGVPSTHWTGGWVGSKAGLDVSKTGKSAARSVCSPGTILLILYRLTSSYLIFSIPLTLFFTLKSFPSRTHSQCSPLKSSPTPTQTKRLIYQFYMF